MEPIVDRLVYVAGPLRAPAELREADAKAAQQMVDANVLAAKESAQALWKAGVPVICPHTNTDIFEGQRPDGHETVADWIGGDLVMLRRCDAILMLPGWTESEGAKMEYQEAYRLGLHAFQALGPCIRWALMAREKEARV